MATNPAGDGALRERMTQIVREVMDETLRTYEDPGYPDETPFVDRLLALSPTERAPLDREREKEAVRDGWNTAVRMMEAKAARDAAERAPEVERQLLERVAEDFGDVLRELVALHPGSYRATWTLARLRAALAAAPSPVQQEPQGEPECWMIVQRWEDGEELHRFVQWDPEAVERIRARGGAEVTPLYRAPAAPQEPQGEPVMQVGGERMERTLDGFRNAVDGLIATEHQRAGADTHLISVLCDAVRLSREYERAFTSPLRAAPQDPQGERVRLLEGALARLEDACDEAAGARTPEVYSAMMASGMEDVLLELDAARRGARTLLESTAAFGAIRDKRLARVAALSGSTPTRESASGGDRKRITCGPEVHNLHCSAPACFDADGDCRHTLRTPTPTGDAGQGRQSGEVRP